LHGSERVRRIEGVNITVIGLGPMGQAMVDVFLSHEHRVTVWNRTASRADAVVARGATLAATPAEAVAASELVVLSLTDYQAMYDILGGIESLAGKTIVNLSSDTPDASREAGAWVRGRGGAFVTGGVMVPAPMVGAEGAYVYYSGPAEEFDAYADELALLGRPEYVGVDDGLAQLWYQAQLDVFLTSLAAFLHAAALLAEAGVKPSEFAPAAASTFQLAAPFLDEAAQSIEAGEHPGDLSTVLMMGATADHVVGASEASGVDAALPKAVQSLYRKAIEAGHGRSNWTSLYEVLKPR
jgi:3-hydroxyisobutyrate dehydrogenase-like beta-hydroxyacid dehydrogenase